MSYNTIGHHVADRLRGYRTLRVAERVTFRRVRAPKLVLKIVATNVGVGKTCWSSDSSWAGGSVLTVGVTWARDVAVLARDAQLGPIVVAWRPALGLPPVGLTCGQ